MKNLKKLILTAVASGTLATNFAFAATQGSEGTTSTGTSDISVTIPKLVKITGIANLAGGTYNGGAGGFNQNDDVCIYSNMDTGTGTYRVNVTNTGNPVSSPTSGFYVGNLANEQEIEFALNWNDESGTTGESALTEAANLTGQNGFSNDPACSGGNNANFHATMTQADMLAVKPGAYTTTITILITPE